MNQTYRNIGTGIFFGLLLIGYHDALSYCITWWTRFFAAVLCFIFGFVGVFILKPGDNDTWKHK